MPASKTALALLLLLSAGVVGAVPASDAKPSPPDMHTSRNALDWAGTYEGVLPCADCPGIRTRLTLRQDGRFELSLTYLERKVEPFKSQGSFRWNADGNTITLDDGSMYRVGEGRLLQLDRNGAVPAPGSHNRTLTKLAADAAPAASARPLAQTLHDHRWTLRRATDAQGKSIPALAVGAPIVFAFDAGRIAIQGACNNMNSGYDLSADGQLKLGRLAATMKACEPALMQADSALAKLLAQPLKAEFTAGLVPTLHLTTPAHEMLAFVGQPTLASLYGAPTRMFLEVAAQTVPCQPGAGAPTKCLQVRERQFDAQGLPVSTPGDWRAFYGGIQGYTHQPGVRNVLRIDRYTRTNVPADASRTLYVLDMVVESAQEPK